MGQEEQLISKCRAVHFSVPDRTGPRTGSDRTGSVRTGPLRSGPRSEKIRKSVQRSGPGLDRRTGPMDRAGSVGTVVPIGTVWPCYNTAWRQVWVFGLGNVARTCQGARGARAACSVEKTRGRISIAIEFCLIA